MRSSVDLAKPGIYFTTLTNFSVATETDFPTTLIWPIATHG